MPSHLHGRTQHKTLQARLSEDILALRERSTFFRPAPGKFFLREFITDDSLPTQFRTPIVARRRVRDLPKRGVLAIKRAAVDALENHRDVSCRAFEQCIQSHHFGYVASIQKKEADDILVWAFVVVQKGSMILSYRRGKYREGRDSFMYKRCVGFFNMVTAEDMSLFDQEDHGVLSSGLKAVAMDLDLPLESLGEADRVSRAGFIYSVTDESRDLIALISYECPEWFEPLGQRLSLNDLAWLDTTHAPNNLDDFDPWSRVVLDRVRDGLPGER